nr:wall-associated receptor kinase-like 8 [Quercus suber]
MYKTNYDGVVFAESEEAGIRVIIRDVKGNVIAALAEKISYLGSMEVLEALAARRAAQFVVELGLSVYEFEGDYEVVWRALRIVDKAHSSIGKIIKDMMSIVEEPPISQPGCKDHCGNATIPYPFGIGHSCYMDDWCEIVCNGTEAFLKKINMKVLGIKITDCNGAEENTIRVQSSIINSNSNCVNMSIGGCMNIKGSPFVFSDYMNTFVSFGCNNWATVAETNPMVVGCKSHCNISFIYQEQQRHKCLGVYCC